MGPIFIPVTTPRELTKTVSGSPLIENFPAATVAAGSKKVGNERWYLARVARPALAESCVSKPTTRTAPREWVSR